MPVLTAEDPPVDGGTALAPPGHAHHQSKKSKYYNECGPENFEQARRCYKRAGLADDWRCVVDESTRRAPPQDRFLSGCEEVVACLYPSKKGWFLERAKMCWGMPQAEFKRGSKWI
jgi:hypothetical protein